MKYSINYKKIKNELKKKKSKNVLIQLPDGLKPDYKEIIKNLQGDYEIFIWAGTCFGACDIPVWTEQNGIDTIIHLGHEKWF